MNWTWFYTTNVFIFVVSIAVLVVSIWVIATPSKWDKSVALRICRDGTPILRLSDGSIWARQSSVRAYRVEDEKSVCQ
jgi:hypothetical protein